MTACTTTHPHTSGSAAPFSPSQTQTIIGNMVYFTSGSRGKWVYCIMCHDHHFPILLMQVYSVGVKLAKHRTCCKQGNHLSALTLSLHIFLICCRVLMSLRMLSSKANWKHCKWKMLSRACTEASKYHTSMPSSRRCKIFLLGSFVYIV